MERRGVGNSQFAAVLASVLGIGVLVAVYLGRYAQLFPFFNY